MRILVTGGAGFIGSHITDRLIEGGSEVLVVDNLSTGRRENINPRATFEEIDITDAGLYGVFERFGPDTVCHQAAQVSVRDSVADPAGDARANIIGSINVLESAVKSGVKRFVFASSGGAVYGEQEIFPAPETHPTNPLSPYGIAKRSVEHYLYYYNQVKGLSYAALRYANVYGPRQDPHGEAGVVAIFADKMLGGETPHVNGDGGQTRDYTFVGDVAEANVRALRSGYVGPLNVGTGIETSVVELYDMLKSATGYTGDKTHGPAMEGEQRRSVVDHSLITKELGWEPTVGFKEGLAKTVDHFRNPGR